MYGVCVQCVHVCVGKVQGGTLQHEYLARRSHKPKTDRTGRGGELSKLKWQDACVGVELGPQSEAWQWQWSLVMSVAEWQWRGPFLPWGRSRKGSKLH